MVKVVVLMMVKVKVAMGMHERVMRGVGGLIHLVA